MHQITESDSSTSLDAMWTAYRRSRLESVENCPVCRTRLRLVALVLVYKVETADRKSGEGVGAALTTTFGYDYSGQRVISQTASSTTVFPNKYFSIKSQTIASTTYATSTSYIFAGDTQVAYIEQDLIDGTATGTPRTFYVHPDHLGSTNVITDQNGGVVSSKDYFPYGSIRVESGDASLARGYIGQFEDGNNLSYLQNRYYQSDRGQFLSQDPVFLALGDPKQLSTRKVTQQTLLSDPQLLNSYSYARNNPIRYSDPTGELIWVPAAWLAIEIIGAFSAGYGAGEVINSHVLFRDDYSDTERSSAVFWTGVDVVTGGAGTIARGAKTGLKLYESAALNLGPDVVQQLEGYRLDPNSRSNPFIHPFNAWTAKSSEKINPVQYSQSIQYSLTSGQPSNLQNQTAGGSSGYSSQTYRVPSGAIVDWGGNVVVPATQAPSN